MEKSGNDKYLRRGKTTGARGVRILLSAGEVSGDLIGAGLAQAIRTIDPGVILSGVGGGRMEEAGVDVFFKTNHLGTVGIGEAMDTIPTILRSFKAIRLHVSRNRPDLVVLIGHDVFHLLLSRWFRADNIDSLSYFPPNVWLWRGIAGLIAKSYDCILTSFPEEDAVYRKGGAQTVFVGHYLRDQIHTVLPEARRVARESLKIDTRCRLVSLLPGSRLHEVERLMPVFLESAREMIRTDPQIRFVLPPSQRAFDLQLDPLECVIFTVVTRG